MHVHKSNFQKAFFSHKLYFFFYGSIQRSVLQLEGWRELSAHPSRALEQMRVLCLIAE